jgi:hypothetical protein
MFDAFPWMKSALSLCCLIITSFCCCTFLAWGLLVWYYQAVENLIRCMSTISQVARELSRTPEPCYFMHLSIRDTYTSCVSH